MNLAATLRGTTYRFRDVKEVLAKANEEKSGDRLAGAGGRQRVRAGRRQARAGRGDAAPICTRTRSSPPSSDAVTRLILDDLQRPVYESRASPGPSPSCASTCSTTRIDGAELLRLSRGLTSEMIAACAKLMTNLDLIYAARKIRVVVHATNTVGLPGRLSVRLQPNHPSDSIEGILASLREGLSYGAATRSSASTRSPTTPSRPPRS